MRRIFYPLTYIYRCLVWLDKFFGYRRRKIISASLAPLKIISIGNITWGGNGKTPMAIKTAQDIYSISGGSRRIAVILRGYRLRKRSEGFSARIISYGDKIDPERVGDEAAEIASALCGMTNLAVIACANRYEAACAARQKYNADFVIMDDGFQRWDMPRDLDIVCVNAMNPFGNRMLIPSGILREPIKNLYRADAVILTNADMVTGDQLNDLKNIVKKISGEKQMPVYESRMEFVGLLKVCADGNLRREENARRIKGIPLVGFSGLGSNESFKKFIEKNLAPLEKFYSFGDHHWYSAKEIYGMLLRHDGATLITSRKDAMRILALIRKGKLTLSSDDRIYAIEANIVFATKQEEGSWRKLLGERLSLTETAR